MDNLEIYARNLELQCQSLAIQADLKEYAANWLKEAKTVTRDATGKFASKVGQTADAVGGAVTGTAKAIRNAAVAVIRNERLARGLKNELAAETLERFARIFDAKSSDSEDKNVKISEAIKLVIGELIDSMKKGFQEALKQESDVIKFNSDKAIKDLSEDKEAKSSLEAQGVDFQKLIQAAERLKAGIDNSKIARNPYEVLNRKEDLMRLMQRIQEIKQMTQSKVDPSSPDFQCRLLPIKSEIMNGELVDNFLKSNREMGDRTKFIDQVSAREPITGEPRTSKQDIDFKVKIGGTVYNQLEEKNRQLAGGKKSIAMPLLETDTAKEKLAQADRLIPELSKLLPTPLKAKIGCTPPTFMPSPPFALPQDKEPFINTGTFDFDMNMVLIHEAGHIYENQQRLGDLTNAYIESRRVSPNNSNFNYPKVADKPTYDFRRKGMGALSGPNVPDTDMSISYAGLKYNEIPGERGKNSEVISTGFESLSRADSLKSISINDREHLMFTLSVLDKSVGGSSPRTRGAQK